MSWDTTHTHIMYYHLYHKKKHFYLLIFFKFVVIMIIRTVFNHSHLSNICKMLCIYWYENKFYEIVSCFPFLDQPQHQNDVDKWAKINSEMVLEQNTSGNRNCWGRHFSQPVWNPPWDPDPVSTTCQHGQTNGTGRMVWTSFQSLNTLSHIVNERGCDQRSALLLIALKINFIMTLVTLLLRT